MSKLLAGLVITTALLILVMSPTAASAATVVLDPGPGTNYLSYWCGGQHMSEIATGFDAGGDAVTLVTVTTTCHGSGRGALNQYYLSCWNVSFAPDGAIVARQMVATNHWRQGQPAEPCPVTADPAAVYTNTDPSGRVLATLSTELVGTGSGELRAVLETPCAPLKLGDSVSGTIGEPGEEACYSFHGSAGDGVRVGVTETSDDLVAAEEVRRPDGSVLCGTASGSVDCTLDASGVHTVFVRDSSGTGTGGYDLSLACLTPSCGAAPHLTIGMTAALGNGRFFKTIAYAITVGNNGTYPASDVVLVDTLPPGLFLRSLSTSQGTCSHLKREASCAIGTVAPGANITVNVSAVVVRDSDAIVNTACVDVDAGACATAITTFP